MLFRFGKLASRACSLAVLSAFAVVRTNQLQAQNVVRIDATVVAPVPQPVPAHLGSNRTPQGKTLGVNSEYLTLDGHPWLPVMGEFHFSRYPEAEWEQEILKMKVAGIDVISTYVIWIHHEQNEGVFDWSGQRDLRKFVELCGRHGMYVYPRIGPWAHAETRNGGLPDWVLKNSPVRQNDPVYLREVGTFYAQIARQLNGLLWKDGGPVIGIQIENEYRDTGPGKGAEHIRALRQIAISDGLDVPLYTVTGWDGAAIPLDAVLPVFGGYPDAPWDSSAQKLPPNEIYAFRFDNRVAGSMGAIASAGQNAASTYRGTPFLTAEVGSGIEDTYFRRPVVTADDIAAIAPVMLGSGVNLLGYYMFHGGRNPDGSGLPLQESQRTGYPTDVPVKSYDFQAPLGEFGQERESLRKLKLVHYFLHDFGESLAPMVPHAPSVLPASPSDVSVPRVSARTQADSGYIFFNNHVRGAATPSFPGFQVELQLPSETIKVPEKPIDLTSGSYGIWPVNLSLGGCTLRYATAQLFKRLVVTGETYYFFFAIPGIEPELAFDKRARIDRIAPGVKRFETDKGVTLRVHAGTISEVLLHGGVTIVVLPEANAEMVWQDGGSSLLLSTAADAFSDGSRWTLDSTGDPVFTFGLFGAGVPSVGGKTMHRLPVKEIFTEYTQAEAAIHLRAELTQESAGAPRGAWQLGPKLAWRPEPIVMAPDDTDFTKATSWSLKLPAIPAGASVSDVFLRINYQGDAARLYGQKELIDDNFWNGLPWEIGLRETASDWRAPEDVRLEVLQLPQRFPMYIENASQLSFHNGEAMKLTGVELLPQYELVVDIPAAR
jgi:beta-galactosidase